MVANQATTLRLSSKDSKIASKRCIESFYFFVKSFWGVLNTDPLIPNWHMEYLCNLLQDQFEKYLAGGDYYRDVICNVPPGTSKSTIFSQMFPVWCWLHAPHLVFITTSFSEIATDHSTKSKLIFKSQKFAFYFTGYFETKFGKRIRIAKDTEKLWSNNFGGQRIIGATKSGVTSRHAHIIIRDDPMSQQGSLSEAERKATHNFNDSTLPTRKKDKENSITFTVMQRLHTDDTTGHELAKANKKILHVCLPATLDHFKPKPEYLAKYYVNGLLDPIRLSRKALATQETDLGTQDYMGQFEQTPEIPGGNKIKNEWFEYCNENELPGYLVWDMWIDGAYTKVRSNDATGMMVCAFDERNNRLYKRYFHSDWLEINELMDKITEITQNYKFNTRSRIYIEPKATGKTLAQLINKKGTNLSAIEIKSYLVQEGKLARCQAAVPKYETKRITHVRGSWTQLYEKQLTTYPNYTQDEAIDLAGYAVDHYFKETKVGVKRRN